MKISAGNNLESHDNDDDDDDDGYYYDEDLTIINFMFMIFSSTTQETGAESETPVPTAITAEVDPHVAATSTTSSSTSSDYVQLFPREPVILPEHSCHPPSSSESSCRILFL